MSGTLSLSEIYVELCKNHNIEVQECVQKALLHNLVLDLSNQTLDIGTCAVLGKLLHFSQTLTKLSLEDCLLKEESMKSLLLGLCGNSSVRTLSLKGNNIQIFTTTALSKMIRHNHTIVRLSLEWNYLGLCSDSFTLLCEALGSNISLQYLDLRSNQLGVEAALPLSKALTRNCALLSLDLRWNSLSKVGGKALLESLQHNHTLTKISLPGNNVPPDIISAIDAHVNQNAQLLKVQQEYTSQANLLKKQMEEQEQHSLCQVEHLERSLAERDRTINTTLRDGIFHVGQLEEEVRAKTQEVEAQTAKYELVSSALRLSQERVSTLEDTLASMETHSQQAQEATLTLQKENRETLERTLREHNEESRTLQKTITQLEAEVGELQFIRENQKKQIFDFKETVCSLQSEVKGIRLECEDVIAVETGKYKEKLKELEQQQTTQMLQLRSQHSQTESEWRESLRVCEVQCSELNAEMVTLRSTLSSERTSTHTHLQSLKKQLKAEHNSAMRSLEEQLQLCVERHEEAEDRVRALSGTNTTLTATNTRLKAEILTLTNELAEMRANVDKKNEEVREAEKKVRLEYSCQEEELRQCKEQSTKLRNTIVELKRTMSELEAERDKRQREARCREEDMQRLRDDEAYRISLLHSAFLSYFNSSSSHPPAPPNFPTTPTTNP